MIALNNQKPTNGDKEGEEAELAINRAITTGENCRDKYERKIKQLEEQNAELQDRLTKAETVMYADDVRQTALSVFKSERLPKHFEEIKRDTQNMFNADPVEYMIELAEYEFYYELGKRHKELRDGIRKRFKDEGPLIQEIFTWEYEA